MAALAFRTHIPFKSRAMQTHQKRPVRDELEELYGIAVQVHGADSRAGRLIRRALDQEREEAARAADGPRRPPTRRPGGDRPR